MAVNQIKKPDRKVPRYKVLAPQKRATFNTSQYTLVVCRNPQTGKYLAIRETEDRGWWIPGGGVESGETFSQSAIRECREEGGISILLKGILKVEHSAYQGDRKRMLVIYYAEPWYNDVIPKSIPDEESEEARWVSLSEFEQFPKIRGNQLLTYGNQIESGKPIFPLNLIDEGKATPKSDSRVMRLING